jgi:hypothetical protein
MFDSKKTTMKSLITIPLIMLVCSVNSFGSAKPRPRRITVPFHRKNGVQTRTNKSFEIEMTVIDFNERLEGSNSFNFKSGERYPELLNSGLARKRKKIRNA